MQENYTMNQKKISIITTETDESSGGIQKWMYNLYQGIQSKGYKTFFFSYKKLCINNYIFALQSDLLFLPTWKIAFFFLPILILFKKKIIILVHGNEFLKINFPLNLLFCYLIKRKNTYFIANSYSIAKKFSILHNRDVDFVQYPFLSVKNNSLYNKIYRNHHNKKRFITICRLVKRKNIINVLEAFYYLKKNNFCFLYFIAGKGPEYMNIKNQIMNLNLERQVFLLGHITESKKNILLRNSDYFIMPSVLDVEDSSIEGYGISFIEANSFGIPVISGNTGGMVESVVDGKTGIHSDGTVKNLIQQIEKITKTHFEKDQIFKHARNHDYRRQQPFYDFVQKVLEI